jgi:VanZ family protein
MTYLPAALVAAGIAIASLWENPQMPEAVALTDKTWHLIMYAVLGLALMAAFVANNHSRIYHYVLVWVSVTAYGAMMEVLPHFCTLTRSGEIADLYADALGALIGVALVGIWYAVRKKQNTEN